MPLFDFDQAEKIGVVQSVDTGTVVVRVTETEQLSMLQVNHMVAIRACASMGMRRIWLKVKT